MEISHLEGINLTAYAVRGAENLFVTVINKEYGAKARAADIAIVADGFAPRAGAIFLTATNGDVAAKTGVTLGGAAIGNDGPWLGQWTPLTPDKRGQISLKLAAASAVVVKITESKYKNKRDCFQPVGPLAPGIHPPLRAGRGRAGFRPHRGIWQGEIQTARPAACSGQLPASAGPGLVVRRKIQCRRENE